MFRAFHRPLGRFFGYSQQKNWRLMRSFASTPDNYYDILGVDKSASLKDVKKAYYEKAKQYHPDRNRNDPEAAAKFRKAAEAFEVLGDEQKRRHYDMSRMKVRSSSFGQGPSYSRPAGTASDFEFRSYGSSVDPEELFRRIFQEATGRQYDSRVFREFFDPQFIFRDFAESRYGSSPTSQIAVRLSFLESALGCEKVVRANVSTECPRCQGTGAELGTKVETCPSCYGRGVVYQRQALFTVQVTCPKCRGSGNFIRFRCQECRGIGKMILPKDITIAFPAGVNDGDVLRVRALGNEILVTVNVAEDSTFTRRNDDIYSELTVSVSQAIFGGRVRTKGIHSDPLYVSIAAGTQGGSQIRLSGQGIQRTTGGRGDHYLTVKISVPKSLSPQQRDALLMYAHSERNVPGTISGVGKERPPEDGPTADGVRMETADDGGRPVNTLLSVFRRFGSDLMDFVFHREFFRTNVFGRMLKLFFDLRKKNR